MRSAAERQFMLESLPRFSKILNGLRPGELTVFTGPTGCGKTTLLSQMSLDYCTQGLTVLWGSFEIRNTRLAQVMLQQAAQSPLTDGDKIAEDRFIQAASALRAAPMHFMNLFGSTGLGVVLDAMECAMQPGGIKPHLVILDNLQFMLSGQATNSLDKWELMERAISELRNFCNTYPVHVILVVHPRKELDDTSLGLASVSGTAKATQEADNVIILQKLGERRYIDVRKNRYHGDLGRVQIGYVPESRMVFEIKEEAGGNNSPEDEE
jgi:twinkle protein